MPIYPLTFLSIEKVRANVQRLREAKLVTTENVAGVTKVNAKEALASELLVAENGDTYLLSDLLALSEAEAKNEPLQFVTKHGGFRSVLAIQHMGTANLIHNKPLAALLNTLSYDQAHFVVDTELTSGILFPFSTIFPVITQDEVSQEAFRLEHFYEYCDKARQASSIRVTLPNHPLAQLLLYANKTAAQHEDYRLGLVVLADHCEPKPLTPSEQLLVERHRKWRDQPLPQLRQRQAVLMHDLARLRQSLRNAMQTYKDAERLAIEMPLFGWPVNMPLMSCTYAVMKVFEAKIVKKSHQLSIVNAHIQYKEMAKQQEHYEKFTLFKARMHQQAQSPHSAKCHRAYHIRSK